MSELRGFLLPNEPTCIVACSGTEARLWKSTSRFGAWTQIADMQNPENVNRESEFASDRPGRAFDSVGGGRHAMSTSHSGLEHELTRFAEQVAEHINRALAAGDFVHLVLIAEPRFLGHLRDKLSAAAAAAVILEASKNLMRLNGDEIRNYFQ